VCIGLVLAFLQGGTLCKMLKYIYIYIWGWPVMLGFLSSFFISLMGLNEVALFFLVMMGRIKFGLGSKMDHELGRDFEGWI
jgi:hypothetical protein